MHIQRKIVVTAVFAFLMAFHISAAALAETTQTPIVSFTQWYTTSPVIQSPSNQMADIPPVIQVASPANQTILQNGNASIVIDVASYFWVIDSVYYQADWQGGIHQIFGIQPDYEQAINATITASFSQIPIGNHTVTFYANTHDGMTNNATVTFTTEGYTIPTVTTKTNTQSPTPTLAPPIPELSWLAVVSLFLSVFSVAVIVRHLKTNKRNIFPT